MELSIKFDEARLKELVKESAEQIKKDMCADCPYKESEEQQKE